MLLLILQILMTQDVPDGVTDALLQVSPYNAVAYGALVAVLLFFGYLQWKEKEKQAVRMDKLADTLMNIEIQLRQLDDVKHILLNFNWRNNNVSDP
jgi:hypothetical protein